MRRLTTLTLFGILLLLVLTPPARAAFVRNLAWLSLQRAVLGDPTSADVNLACAGAGFARAAAILPGDPLALDALGLVYLQYDDDASAARLFSQVPSGSLWADAARLHLLIAETRGLASQGAVVGGAARDWCDPAGMARQVAAFTGQGQCDRGYAWLSWIEARCEISPAVRAGLLVSIGACYVAGGQPLAGVGHLENALLQAPEHIPAWLALGDAWLSLGDFARALQAYTAAARLDPAAKGVQERLRSLDQRR